MLCLPLVPAREGSRHHFEGLPCAPQGCGWSRVWFSAQENVPWGPSSSLETFKVLKHSLLVPALVKWPTQCAAAEALTAAERRQQAWEPVCIPPPQMRQKTISFSQPFPFLACPGTAWRHFVMSWCQVSGL